MHSDGGGCIILDSGSSADSGISSLLFDTTKSYLRLTQFRRTTVIDEPLSLEGNAQSQKEGSMCNQAESEPVSQSNTSCNKTLRLETQNLAQDIDLDENGNVQTLDLEQESNVHSLDLEQDYQSSKWSKLSKVESPQTGAKHHCNRRTKRSSVRHRTLHCTVLQDESIYVTVILQQRDADGDNRLFISLILERPNLVQSFIDLIPRHDLFDCWNNLRQTALHIAALTKDATLTRRLLVAGSIVDRRDWAGNTPLHIACRMGNISVAEALLKPVSYSETKQNSYAIPYQRIPQNLEIRNTDGLTCLLLAAGIPNKKLMDILISKDADINAVDMKSGKTCLHMFAENGDSEMVKYVLHVDRCNVDMTTYAGFSALEFAHYRGHQTVVNQLLRAGAKYRVRPTQSPDFLAQLDSDECESDDDECYILD